MIPTIGIPRASMSDGVIVLIGEPTGDGIPIGTITGIHTHTIGTRHTIILIGIMVIIILIGTIIMTMVRTTIGTAMVAATITPETAASAVM